MTYSFEKSFPNPVEAIQEAMATSWSLKMSDLAMFSACTTLEEFDEVLQSETWQRSWATAEVYAEGGWFTFDFATCSGANSLRLVVVEPAETRAFYTVNSGHSIRDSSAARAFLTGGWSLTEEPDAEEQHRLEEAEDAAAVTALREQLHGGKLTMRFHVSFEAYPGGWSVTGHSIYTDPAEDIRAIALCPELAAPVLAVARKELGRVFDCPEQYEYNERVYYEDDGYYSRKWEEYRQGLIQLITFCEEVISEQIGEEAEDLPHKQAIRKPRYGAR